MKIPFAFLRGLSFRRIKMFVLLFILLCGAATILIIILNREVKADINVESETLPEIDFAESDFMLYIDKLGVKSPVVPDVDGVDKETYFSALQGGVAHMKGTPKPDEDSNVVIFGHSNFYSNDPGLYKTIFAHLNELAPQDEIKIRYQGKDYQYQVKEQKIVKPSDVWVITADYDLTIITCWPPGSIDKRLVIFADKVS